MMMPIMEIVKELKRIADALEHLINKTEKGE